MITALIFTLLLVSQLNASSIGHGREVDGHHQHHNAFGDASGGHESGYELAKQGGHHVGHAVHEAAAAHQAAGGGEGAYQASAHHASGEADDGTAKFHEADNRHGKDLKAKTFGFFDYRFIQPQYRVEQFYEDEQQGKRYGADKHKAGLADHHNDEHEEAGRDRFQQSHNDGAHGATDYSKEMDGNKGSGGEWKNGYANEADSNHNYGRGEQGRQHGHVYESAPPAEYQPDHYYPTDQHHRHHQPYEPRYVGPNEDGARYLGSPHGIYQQ